MVLAPVRNLEPGDSDRRFARALLMQAGSILLRWPEQARRAGEVLVRLLRTSFSRSTWAALANLGVSLLVGALFAAFVVSALLVSLATAWIVGVGVAVRSGTLRVAAQMARFERWRTERFGGSSIELLALPRAQPGASFGERQVAWGRAPWLWRLVGYQVVRVPLAATLAFGVVGWTWATVVCFVLAAQPRSPINLLAWKVGPVSLDGGEVAVLVLVGVVGITAWSSILRGASHLDALLTSRFLGPSPSRLLTAEISRLNQARTLAVESAEAERRRIERDLHDGLQPQLVSLALDLGLARTRFERDPEAAQAMVERAHEEAKRATEDLRNLVRGIHPSVLDERGLDAALSALVAVCSAPVFVKVNLSRRPHRTTEAAAYFVIAEALTNVTKHSTAHRASVIIDEHDGTLSVVVEDDGQGGARLAPGGGLAGLADRVASIDGSFSLLSPPGGPTRIEAVIPCGP
jgi:signal transduction histidine kinase